MLSRHNVARAHALIALVSLGVVGTSSCQAQEAAFALSVRPVLPVRVGDSLSVEVLVLNNTDNAQPALVILAWPSSQLSLSLVGPRGPVQLGTTYSHSTLEAYARDYHSAVPPRGFVGRRITVWPSQGEVGDTEALPPGTYRLSGGIHIFPDGKHGIALSSDTTSFSIAPKQ